MGLTEREREWGSKASRFLKAELKRAGIGYKEFAERLNKHGYKKPKHRSLENWPAAPSRRRFSWRASVR